MMLMTGTLLLTLLAAPAAKPCPALPTMPAYFGSIATPAHKFNGALFVETLLNTKQTNRPPCRLVWPERQVFFGGGDELQAVGGAVALFAPNSLRVMDVGFYDEPSAQLDHSAATPLSFYEGNTDPQNLFTITVTEDWRTGKVQGLTFTWLKDGVAQVVMLFASPLE